MAHDKLLNIFENVGLGQKHLSIYLYLLEFGPKKASQLAVFLRLNRSVTYDYLEELVSFNLIVLIPHSPFDVRRGMLLLNEGAYLWD